MYDEFDSALDFSESNSAGVIVPASSKAFTLLISSVGPALVPVTLGIYWSVSAWYSLDSPELRFAMTLSRAIA